MKQNTCKGISLQKTDTRDQGLISLLLGGFFVVVF